MTVLGTCDREGVYHARCRRGKRFEFSGKTARRDVQTESVLVGRTRALRDASLPYLAILPLPPLHWNHSSGSFAPERRYFRVGCVHPKIGANFRISQEALKLPSVPAPFSGRPNGVTLSSLLSLLSSLLGGRAYSALPCAGAPPPQRPRSYNLPRRPGIDIGNRCPIERVSPKHLPPAPSNPCRGRPCACPLPPLFWDAPIGFPRFILP